jgi:hypothetical protein
MEHIANQGWIGRRPATSSYDRSVPWTTRCGHDGQDLMLLLLNGASYNSWAGALKVRFDPQDSAVDGNLVLLARELVIMS